MLTLRRGFFVVLLITIATTIKAQIISDFANATGADGWTTFNNVAGISHSTALGNPPGSVFSTPFSFTGGMGTTYFNYFFVAPPKFEGNRSAYYNGTLRYDVQQSTTGTPNQYPEVVITNNAGVSLYYFPPTSNQPPATSWATYTVVLNNATGFWKTTAAVAGTAATEAQLQSTLADLADLQIRGLYRDANVTTRLDNVTLYPPIVVTTQPTLSEVCNGATTTFTTAAGNNAAITYRWQRETSPGVFTDITDGGGYSGATTTTLTVNTTGNFGAGNHRCRISGTRVVDAYTLVVALVINALPPPPTTTDASSCSVGPLLLRASGGTAGQYRWYTAASGGTPIAGATTDTYGTPIQLATMTYHVAINNGACESTRTAVTGYIFTPPSAPTGTGGSRCGAGVVTLTASGGTAGQYRWYTTETGGTPISGQVDSNFVTPSLTASTTYYVAINDGHCESVRTPVLAGVDGASCTNHAPVIETSPASTQIGGTIQIDLSDLITDADNNLDLSTLAIITPPASGAQATISNNILTINYTSISFAGTENITIRVCDIFAACTQQTFPIVVDGSLEVYNAISPRKDGKNDVFFIKNIDKLENAQKNHVSIYNRWGDLVWEADNYNNASVAFTGKSKNDGELPSGTYFYKIDFGGKRDAVTGYLVLKR